LDHFLNENYIKSKLKTVLEFRGFLGVVEMLSVSQVEQATVVYTNVSIWSKEMVYLFAQKDTISFAAPASSA
jgi:hypothetical protein